MTKSTRNIIITAVVIALLVGGILILNAVDFSSDDNKAASTAQPSYTIYSKDVSDLANVTVTTDDTVIEAINSDGSWTIQGMDLADVDSSKVYTLVSTVSTISSRNKIEENVTDFAQYGLEKPSISVMISDKNGGADALYIGDKSPTLGEYFIRMNSDTTVYTLYAYKVETILQPLSYYSDFNRFNINIDDITGIKIEREGETVELRIAENISDTVNNVWEMTKPYESSANDEYVDSNILAAIEKLTFNLPLTDGGNYGTDNPKTKITLTVKPYDSTTGKYGKEYTETFGIGNTANGKAYVGYNGKIYEVDASAVEFANASAFNILNKLQALVDISVVKAFTVTADNKSDTVEISRSGDDMQFKLRGEEVDQKTAKTMYQAMISLAVDGTYRGENLGETVLAIDYKTLKSGDDVSIEFKSINDLSCALVRNGKAEFTIKKNKIEEFVKLWNEYVKETSGGNNDE